MQLGQLRVQAQSRLPCAGTGEQQQLQPAAIGLLPFLNRVIEGEAAIEADGAGRARGTELLGAATWTDAVRVRAIETLSRKPSYWRPSYLGRK